MPSKGAKGVGFKEPVKVKTDIPLRANQPGMGTERQKDIVFIGGVGTWKTKNGYRKGSSTSTDTPTTPVKSSAPIKLSQMGTQTSGASYADIVFDDSGVVGYKGSGAMNPVPHMTPVPKNTPVVAVAASSAYPTTLNQGSTLIKRQQETNRSTTTGTDYNSYKINTTFQESFHSTSSSAGNRSNLMVSGRNDYPPGYIPPLVFNREFPTQQSFTPHTQQLMNVHHILTVAGVPKAKNNRKVAIQPATPSSPGTGTGSDGSRSFTFLVDASQAGEGNMEISVNAQGRAIPSQVTPLGGGRFSVSYTATEAVPHAANIIYNGEHVTGRNCFYYYYYCHIGIKVALFTAHPAQLLYTVLILRHVQLMHTLHNPRVCIY